MIVRSIIFCNKYLNKEIYNRIKKTTMKTKIRKPNRNHKRLLLSASEQIIRLEANLNYTTFVLKSGQQKIMSYTLKLYDVILPHPFLRVNRQCIINMNFIKNLNSDNKVIILNDGTEILISRRRWESVCQNVALAS